MRRLRFILVTAAAVSLLACGGRNVDTVWDTEFDFGGLNTYGWAAKEPEGGPDYSYEALDASIRAAVDRRLAESGFRLRADEPSFLVTYYIGVEELAEVSEEYYGRGWGGYWGWGWYGPAGLNVSLYDAGTITIDVLSRDPQIGLIWRGIARTDLSPASRTASVDGAIREILSDFPPQEER